jgi:hypothetical protein
MRKIGNQIEFSCVNGKDPSWIFPQIRRFVELILKYEDPDFRRFLISQFFDASISINPLKNYADDLALCSGLSKEDVFKKLFLDVVDRELNALIDLADPDGEIIRWRFNSTEY